MNREELIAERILQLDNLYAIARDIRYKALILSQMLHLAKAIEPEFLKDEKILIGYDEPEEYKGIRISEAILRVAYSTEKAYYDGSITAYKTIAKAVTMMDYIRTKILTMLIEYGLIKRFREIPVAIAGDNYADANEID